MAKYSELTFRLIKSTGRAINLAKLLGQCDLIKETISVSICMM